MQSWTSVDKTECAVYLIHKYISQIPSFGKKEISVAISYRKKTKTDRGFTVGSWQDKPPWGKYIYHYESVPLSLRKYL